MKAKFIARALPALLACLACGWLTGCASSKAPSYYKTTLAEPHPYPRSTIETREKPVLQKDGTYLFVDEKGKPYVDLDGTPITIPKQYIAKIEKKTEAPDKNDRDLFESRGKKDYNPSKPQFFRSFEFR